VTDRIYNVLFLCRGNSARSILAEQLLERLGGGRFGAYSAGSQPTGRVHPMAVALLGRKGYATNDLRSKSWSEYAAPGAPAMDLVITVCDAAGAETCPIWPAHPLSVHWGIPDPAAVDGNEQSREAAFLSAFENLHQRITYLVSLPVESMDRRTLARTLTAVSSGPA